MKIRPLRRDDWRHVERLFGENGACMGCWCRYWDVADRPVWRAACGDANRRALAAAIRAGEVHAVLAFDGDEPVGWCRLGPRDALPRVERLRTLRRRAAEGVWSVVCFFVPARRRGQGIAQRLLEGATRRAFALGATEVEGFPVTPRAGRVPGTDAYTGVSAMFRQTGYRKLRRAAGLRPIWIRRPD